MRDVVVSARGLTKTFGSFIAVNGVDLTVRQGEIYGFLGPNGAGKTTTLLMLLGIVRPNAGEIALFGRPLGADACALRRRVGVVTEYQSFYDEMTALEYLRFFGQLYRVKDAEARALALLERLELVPWRDGIIGTFSTGMRKKLGFARAFLHTPDLLILDEPVSGLDPRGIIQVRELVAEARANGATVLISSHVLSEVEVTADRVGILTGGRLIVEDTTANLERRVRGQQQIEIELVEVDDALPGVLTALPYVQRLERARNQLTVYTAADRDYRADLGRVLSEQRAIVQAMTAHRASLEEIFITITESDVSRWVGNHASEYV